MDADPFVILDASRTEAQKRRRRVGGKDLFEKLLHEAHNGNDGQNRAPPADGNKEE